MASSPLNVDSLASQQKGNFPYVPEARPINLIAPSAKGGNNLGLFLTGRVIQRRWFVGKDQLLNPNISALILLRTN